MSALPLDGRVAIVTGANHGIGAATAEELARLGADVVVTYLRPPTSRDHSGSPPAYHEQRSQDATWVLQAVENLGRRCLAIECDLREDTASQQVFDAAEKGLGPVSILVNNASGWRQDTFAADSTDRFGRSTEQVSAASADSSLLVDARAAALLISELARRLRLHGIPWGRIIGLCSGTSQGFPGEVSYGAAKAALLNYTMSAAAELARQGVTANVVYPPITDTGWVTNEVRRYAQSQGSLVAKPSEVAEVIGWLCTEVARLVTGNVIRLR